MRWLSRRRLPITRALYIATLMRLGTRLSYTVGVSRSGFLSISSTTAGGAGLHDKIYCSSVTICSYFWGWHAKCIFLTVHESVLKVYPLINPDFKAVARKFIVRLARLPSPLLSQGTCFLGVYTIIFYLIGKVCAKSQNVYWVHIYKFKSFKYLSSRLSCRNPIPPNPLRSFIGILWVNFYTREQLSTLYRNNHLHLSFDKGS